MSLTRVVHISVVTVVACLFLFATTLAFGQDYVFATGSPTFTTALPVEHGFINVANGNLHIEIPLASPPQRGSLRVNERLVYESRIWQPVFNGTSTVWQPTNVPNSQGGWRFVSGADSGAVNHLTSQPKCNGTNWRYVRYAGWSWTDPSGTRHTFSGVQTQAADPEICPDGPDLLP